MSRNVETVEQIYACFGSGDVAGLLARLDPDVEWEHDWAPEPLPHLVPSRGRDGAAAFFAGLAAFEILRFEPAAMLEGGDMVAAVIHVGLRRKASGREHHDLEIHLWTFGPDGLVTRFRHFVDTRQFARMLDLG